MNPAAQKTIEEGACRVCVRRDVESAHLVPRSLNPKQEHWTNPDEVVPLCRRCHQAYDAGRLDLLPYLSRLEEVAAVKLIGIARAYRRLTCGEKT